MKVAVVYHPDFGRKGHPALSARIIPSFKHLEELGLLDRDNVFVLTPEPVSLDLVKSVHTQHHIDLVIEMACYDMAMLSAGSVALAGETLAKGDADAAFAYVGSAGHHASRDDFWGFCYLNDAAIMINNLRRDFALRRFLIVDVDPHFGDGTRDVFQHDRDVMHINFHSGSGEKYDHENLNYDFGLIHTTEDEEFLKKIDEALLLTKDFEPEMIAVIFGHDSHRDDYGGLSLSLEFFPCFARVMKKLSQEKDCALLFILSGGSEINVAKEAISSVIRVLAE